MSSMTFFITKVEKDRDLEQIKTQFYLTKFSLEETQIDKNMLKLMNYIIAGFEKGYTIVLKPEEGNCEQYWNIINLQKDLDNIQDQFNCSISNSVYDSI